MQNTEKSLSAWNGSPFASPWRLLDEVLGAAPARGRGFAPPVDVSETPDEYLVTAELPGTKPEDVTVELNDGVLTIRGEKRVERDENKEHARYVERVFGSFVRSFTLQGRRAHAPRPQAGRGEAAHDRDPEPLGLESTRARGREPRARFVSTTPRASACSRFAPGARRARRRPRRRRSARGAPRASARGTSGSAA
jgi:HSP20 family molecular chaperone IbpA